jgi:hypothetical protein
MSVVQAWVAAACETFTTIPAQTKGCPKSTFLGLCEAGLVAGVPAGRYNAREDSKNKHYGVRAVALLRQEPSLADDPHALWTQIGNAHLKSNSQMDVVTALWKLGLINE